MPNDILRFKKLSFFHFIVSQAHCVSYNLWVFSPQNSQLKKTKKKKQCFLLLVLILIMLLICPPLPPLLTLGAAAVPTVPPVLDSCSGSGLYSSMTGMVTGHWTHDIVQALLFTALSPMLLGQRRHIHNNKWRGHSYSRSSSSWKFLLSFTVSKCRLYQPEECFIFKILIFWFSNLTYRTPSLLLWNRVTVQVIAWLFLTI